MFFVYILKSSKDNNLYIGYTNDLKRRFEEHNRGNSKSTKSRASFKLLYYEAYLSEKDAKKREENLKLRARALAQLKKRLEYTLLFD